MSSNWLLATAMALLVSSPGCLDGGATDDETRQQSDPNSNPAFNAATPEGIRLDACDNGIVTTVFLPQDLVPAGPPPGWEEHLAPDDEIQIFVFHCERISTGPFERGPIHFLIEQHDRGTAPPNCREGINGAHELLTQLWIDDQEIADYLKREYGMPAQYAEFSYDPQVTGALVDHRWSFGLPGEEPSSLVAGNSTLFPNNQNEHFQDRLFWVNAGKGITYTDFYIDFRSSFFSTHNTIGALRAPFLYAETTHSENYASVGGPFLAAEVDAQFVQFRDTQCDEPL